MQDSLGFSINKLITFSTILIIFLLIIDCGGTKSPELDQTKNKIQQININNVNPDSLEVVQTEKFYKLEQSLDDIQREIEILQTRVLEYDYKPPETNYTKQLKELINSPLPSQKIYLNNGSIIEGTIEKDKLDYLLVKTDLGKLTISKSDIEDIEDLILPVPDIVFIGHGQEEIFGTFRLFTGKVMNQGSRRADFVRIVYNLWGENTQLIISDSSFVSGTKFIYRSGIVTDTVLEPQQSAHFNVQIPIADSTYVAYITRDIHWELYD